MQLPFKSFVPLVSKARFEKIIAEDIDITNPANKVPDDDSIIQDGIVYSYVTILFVSFQPTSNTLTPFSAQMLRALYREAKEIIRSTELLRDIVMSEDYICGIFDSPFKSDIKQLMDVAARLNSLKLYIQKYTEKTLESINYVIGADYAPVYGMDLSTIDTSEAAQKSNNKPLILWKGGMLKKIINSLATRTNDKCVYVTQTIYDNLSNEYQNFFSRVTLGDFTEIGCKKLYKSNFYNISMNAMFK